MLTMVICDDEPLVAQKLEDQVTTALMGQSARIQTFVSREALEAAIRNGPDPDIALLDIKLPGDNGIQLARALFPEGSRTQVIFVTGYPEYHTEAYETEHIYFLLKPVEEESLRRALLKAQRRLERLGPSALTLSTRSQTVYIPFAEIRYIESLGTKIAIVQVDKRTEYYGTLSSLEEQLPARFVRCHKSFFVNLDYVERMESGQFALKNGDVVPISQLKRASTRQRFLEYLSKKL